MWGGLVLAILALHIPPTPTQATEAAHAAPQDGILLPPPLQTPAQQAFMARLRRIASNASQAQLANVLQRLDSIAFRQRLAALAPALANVSKEGLLTQFKAAVSAL